MGREDGSWDDVDYKFVECRENPPPLEYYYRDLFRVYGGPDGTEGREPYDQAMLDIMFLNSPGTHYPCAPIQARVRSMYPDSRIDDIVRLPFILMKATRGGGPSLMNGYIIDPHVGMSGSRSCISRE